MSAASRDSSFEPTITLRLIGISKTIRATLAMRLAEHGLTVGDDEVLAMLSQFQPTSMARISGALLIRPATVTRVVSRLESCGCVERIAGSLVRLTDRGARMRDAVDVIYFQIDEQVRRHLDAPLLDAFTSQVHALDDGMRRSVEQPV